MRLPAARLLATVATFLFLCSWGAAQIYMVVDTGQSTYFDNAEAITAPSPGQAFYGQDAQYLGNQSSYTLSGDGLTVNDNVTAHSRATPGQFSPCWSET